MTLELWWASVFLMVLSPETFLTPERQGSTPSSLKAIQINLIETPSHLHWNG